MLSAVRGRIGGDERWIVGGGRGRQRGCGRRDVARRRSGGARRERRGSGREVHPRRRRRSVDLERRERCSVERRGDSAQRDGWGSRNERRREGGDRVHWLRRQWRHHPGIRRFLCWSRRRRPDHRGRGVHRCGRGGGEGRRGPGGPRRWRRCVHDRRRWQQPQRWTWRRDDPRRW